MEAKTSSGVFNLKNGFARGDDYLSVKSSGFFARGRAGNGLRRVTQVVIE